MKVDELGVVDVKVEDNHADMNEVNSKRRSKRVLHNNLDQLNSPSRKLNVPTRSRTVSHDSAISISRSSISPVEPSYISHIISQEEQQECLVDELKQSMKSIQYKGTYANIHVMLKDGNIWENSLPLGLALKEFTGNIEMIGREIICPDMTVNELQCKIDEILDCLNPSQKIRSLQQQSRTYISIDDECGGFTGFLPSNDVLVKDEIDTVEMTETIDESKTLPKQEEQVDSDNNLRFLNRFSLKIKKEKYLLAKKEEVAVQPKMKTPSKIYCHKCEKDYSGLMEFHHHSPCVYNGPKNTCRVCGKEFITTNMKNHLSNNPKCAEKMREMHKTWKETIPFTFKRGNLNFVSCKVCQTVFKGYISYYHHKCLHYDENSCRFCKRVCDSRASLRSHLMYNSSCKTELKKLIDHDLKGEAKSPSTVSVKCRRCLKCKKTFKGNVSFFHHKCYYKGRPGHCRFCNASGLAKRYLNGHFARSQSCRKSLIALARKRLESGDDEGKNEISKSVKPRPVCKKCKLKFSGYVSYFHHKCKFDGKDFECRFCKREFSDRIKRYDHVVRNKVCKQLLQTEIKREERYDDTKKHQESDNGNVENLKELAKLQEKGLKVDLQHVSCDQEQVSYWINKMYGQSDTSVHKHSLPSGEGVDHTIEIDDGDADICDDASISLGHGEDNLNPDTDKVDESSNKKGKGPRKSLEEGEVIQCINCQQFITDMINHSCKGMHYCYQCERSHSSNYALKTHNRKYHPTREDETLHQSEKELLPQLDTEKSNFSNDNQMENYLTKEIKKELIIETEANHDDSFIEDTYIEEACRKIKQEVEPFDLVIASVSSGNLNTTIDDHDNHNKTEAENVVNIKQESEELAWVDFIRIHTSAGPPKIRKYYKLHEIEVKDRRELNKIDGEWWNISIKFKLEDAKRVFEEKLAPHHNYQQIVFPSKYRDGMNEAQAAQLYSNLHFDLNTEKTEF